MARTAAKKAKPAPKAQRGERPARGPNRAEQMLQAVVAGPIALADLAESFGIQEHSCRAIISLESRAQGLVVRTVGGLLTVVE